MKLIKYQVKEIHKLKPYLLKFFEANQLKTSKPLEIEEIKKECNGIISFDFVNEISKVSGVSNVVLVSYNGDYMS